MFINNHSISPSNVVRGEGAWADSLDLITKLCKRPLIIGRSSSTKKIRTAFKKDLLLKGKKSCKSHVNNSESIEPDPMGGDMYL